MSKRGYSMAWGDLWRWLLSAASTLLAVLSLSFALTPDMRHPWAETGMDASGSAAMELVRIPSHVPSPAASPAGGSATVTPAPEAEPTGAFQEAPMHSTPAEAPIPAHTLEAPTRPSAPPISQRAEDAVLRQESDARGEWAPPLPIGNNTESPTGEAPPLVTQEHLDPGFRLLKPVSPRYPTGAWQRRLSGRVRLAVEVDDRGAVRQVTILEETRGWGFGDAARAAYSSARFTPPTRQGQPVRVRWLKTLEFQP